MSDDPKAPERLASSAGDGELRALLEAGRGELPSRDQLGSLEAKLGPVLAPGGNGGGSGGGVAVAKGAAGALLAKAIGGAALTIAVGVAVHALRHPSPSDAPATTLATDVPAAPPPPSPAAPAGPIDPPVVPAPSSPPPSASSPVSPRAATSAAPLEDPDAEVALLQKAQAALAADPSRTLALCAEHARRFPNGLMAQEREAMAIEALARTGRIDAARARAARFETSYPSSTHLRRIHAVLDGAP